MDASAVSGRSKSEGVDKEKYEIEAARAASLSVARTLAPVNLPKTFKSKICCGLNPRALVSKKKLRFVSADVDLDLSYVSDNVIAMGWPSVGLEALYRNPVTQVRTFLENRHGGHYRIWNLCVERDYVSTALGFKCEVERFCWYDHCPPPFAMMKPLCDSLHSWTRSDPKNVAVVHCKAGKGRTGTVIAAFLVHSKQAPTAEASLGIFGWRRTRNGRGVTLPGQQRYVAYYAIQVKAIEEDEASWPDPCPPLPTLPTSCFQMMETTESTSEIAIVNVALSSPIATSSTVLNLNHSETSSSSSSSSSIMLAVPEVDLESIEKESSLTSNNPIQTNEISIESINLPVVSVSLSSPNQSITLSPNTSSSSSAMTTMTDIISSVKDTEQLKIQSPRISELSIVEGTLEGSLESSLSTPIDKSISTPITKVAQKEEEDISSSTSNSPTTSLTLESRDVAAQRLTSELLADEKFPATAACIQSITDLDDPLSNVLTIITHRDSDRGMGFSIAPDLSGRPVICAFTTGSHLGILENAPAYSAHIAAKASSDQVSFSSSSSSSEQVSFSSSSSSSSISSSSTTFDMMTLGLVLNIFKLGDEIRQVNHTEVSHSMPFDQFIALLRDATDPLTLVVFRRGQVGHVQNRQILPPVTPEEYKSRLTRAVGPWAAGSDARSVPAPAIRIVSVSLSDSPRLPGMGRFAKMASRCGGSDGKCGVCVRCLEWLCSDDLESGSDDEEDEIEDYLFEGGGDPRREGLYIQILGGDFCRDILFDSRNVEAFAASSKGAGIGTMHGGKGGSESVPEWGPNRAQRKRLALKKSPHFASGVGITGIDSSKSSRSVSKGTSTSSTSSSESIGYTPRSSEDDDEDDDDDEEFAIAMSASTGQSKSGFAPPKPLSRKSRKLLLSRRKLLLKSLESDTLNNTTVTVSNGFSKQASFFIPNPNKSELVSIANDKEEVLDTNHPSSFFKFDPAAGPIEDTEASWGSAYFSQDLDTEDLTRTFTSTSSSSSLDNSDGTNGPAKVCVRGDFRLIVRCIGRKKPLAALWLHTAFLPLPLSLQQCLDDELSNVQENAREREERTKNNDKNNNTTIDLQDIDISTSNSIMKIKSAEHIIGPMPTGKILPGCPTLGAVYSAAGAFTSTTTTTLVSSSIKRDNVTSYSQDLIRIKRASIGCAVFGKNELDGVSKDRKHRAWPQDVQLSITYSLLGISSNKGGVRLPHMYLRSVLK
jgi:phosphatidylinositol-3,4,5-trisphosphate 3-phosphatase and dual-specificity protein phosphatase PTEN